MKIIQNLSKQIFWNKRILLFIILFIRVLNIDAQCSPTNTSITVTECDEYNWLANGQTYTASGVYTHTSIAGSSQIYCAAGANINCANGDEFIGNVTIGSINNTTVCGTTYNDYTAISTNVTAGSSYAISVTNPNNFTGDQVSIWIDWNQDGDFSDAGEEISLSYATGLATGSIAIPATALSGSTTMRIRLNYTGAMSPCGFTQYGEVEDYTLNVGGTSTTGCINTATLFLTINYSTSSITSVTQCNAYIWNGTTYTTSGIYVYTLLNAVGCTHTPTLDLTINYSTSNSTTITSCCNYTWPVNGVTYTVGGTYTGTYLNAAGCLHTETLNLTIHYNTSHDTYVTVTQPPYYTWPYNNQTYTVCGTYMHTSLNAQGCVHTETLVLDCGTTTNSNIVTACDSYTWPCNGITYTSSGVYTCTSFNSCDINTATLFLTIKYSSSSTVSITKCDAYTWSATGLTYTASGTYSKTYINSVNCDSIRYLVLTIDPNYFTLTLAIDQPISCHGNNDASIIVTGNGCGTFTYNIDGGPFGDPCEKFNKLSCGTHTVCMTNGTVTICETIFIADPDPLFPIIITDSYVSSLANDGALSAIINGGTNIITDYYTFWRNSSGTLLNPIPNHHSAYISGLPVGTYSLTVQDDRGCFYTTSTNLSTGPTDVSLYLKCFIEGYWNGSNGMNPVLENQLQAHTPTSCDTITVELHNNITPYQLLYSTQAVLSQTGNAICSFPLASAGVQYYIVVKHRNALQTWSAYPVPIGLYANLYDFSTAANKAYCSNQVLVSGCGLAFFSGDVNQDGNLDLIDLGDVENSIITFDSGYTALDLNGDGNVDILDSTILVNNISNFIFSCHP